MTVNAQLQPPIESTSEATGIRKNWRWFLALGLAQILAGAFALGSSFSTAFGPTMTLGVALLAAGTTQMAAAILARNWDAFYLFLLLAFIYLVAGLISLEHSLHAAEGLSLMLALLFLLIGLFRITVAFVENLPLWGWVLFNGIVAVLLGVAIWRHWPERSVWVLGAAVGIELILNGVTWSIMALGVHKTTSLSA
jgi:uncharacterized membrane protein HdeD (DUF308 family)